LSNCMGVGIQEIFHGAVSESMLTRIIRAWLEQNDQAFCDLYSPQLIEDRIDEYLEIIKTLLDNFKLPDHMILPVIIYANKYIRSHGVKHEQIFYLLLASTICTIKFWDDSATLLNKTVAYAFNYSLDRINKVERDFLQGLDWDLSLSLEELNHFIGQHSKDLTSSKWLITRESSHSSPYDLLPVSCSY